MTSEQAATCLLAGLKAVIRRAWGSNGRCAGREAALLAAEREMRRTEVIQPQIT